MNRPLNAHTRTTTIALSHKSVFVSARNADFPKVSEMIAARVLHPDRCLPQDHFALNDNGERP